MANETFLWEVGDVVEFDGKDYIISDIRSGRREIEYRLDRKFEPSVKLKVKRGVLNG